MASRVPKRERLMNLVAALLAARHPLPFKEIAGRVVGYDDAAGREALEKRFDRDKTELRRLGIPVDYCAEGREEGAGYVIPQDQVFQGRVQFNSEEAMLLSIAGRVGATATGGGALEEALKSALRKLAVDLGGEGIPGDLELVTVLRAHSGSPAALERIATLGQAVCCGQRVAFRYRGLASGKPTEREVDPYGLGLMRGAWYLGGWCHLRGDVRVFKLARMCGPVRLLRGAGSRRQFQVPEGFSMEERLTREPWDVGEGRPAAVLLEVDRVLLGDGFLPEARRLEENQQGALLELQVRRMEAFVPWVLSQGGRVVVRSPQKLRELVARAAQTLQARYEVGPGQEISPLPTRESPGAIRRDQEART